MLPHTLGSVSENAEPVIHAAHVRDLDPVTLYRLLRLRVDVFVVEQRCAYPELDDVDLDPSCVQLWIEDGGVPVATLRLFVQDGQHHLGRVATREEHRGRGYAAALVTEALSRLEGRPVEIGAQTYLEEWYRRFGFRRSGPDYVEDGIPHLPMRRG